MEISLIVAYGKNREIGENGDLPWGRGLPADLANFKKLTSKKCVIMGRKTFESLGKKPLPNRENIVVSSTATGVDGVLTALNLPSALALARYETFIIGGARLYEEGLQVASKIYATEVDGEFSNADTFFPEIDKSAWQETSRIHNPADDKNSHAFDFVVYQKKDY